MGLGSVSFQRVARPTPTTKLGRVRQALSLAAVPGSLPCRENERAKILDFVEQAIAVFAFMGIAYCQRAGGHVRMDLAIRGLRGRWLWLAESLAIVLSLIVVGILIAYGYTHFERAFEQGDSTIDANFPVWPSKLIVPVAFSLLWLRLLLQLVGYMRLFLDPSKTPVGVPTIPTIEDVARQDIASTGDDDKAQNAANRGAGA